MMLSAEQLHGLIASIRDREIAIVEAIGARGVSLQLTPGEQVQAEVIARLPTGQSLANIAGNTLSMPLPPEVKPGETIRLTYLTGEPRPTFALSQSERQGTTTTVSDTARWLAQITRNPPLSATPISRPSQLLATPPTDTQQLATRLQQTLTGSGMFYESHLADWAAGTRPLATILQEPQGSLSQPAAFQKAASGGESGPFPASAPALPATAPLPSAPPTPTTPGTATQQPPNQTALPPSPATAPPMTAGTPPEPATAAAQETVTSSRQATAPPSTPPAGTASPSPENTRPVAVPILSGNESIPVKSASQPHSSPATPSLVAGTRNLNQPAVNQSPATGSLPFSDDRAMAHEIAVDQSKPQSATPGELSPADRRLPGQMPPVPQHDRPGTTASAPLELPAKDAVSAARSSAAQFAAESNGATAPVAKEPADPRTIPLIREQLELLQNRTITWQGDAWPGQPLQWSVTEREANPDTPEQRRSWNSDLNLQLPRLGEVRARLQLSGNTVQIEISSTTAPTAQDLKAGSSVLRDRLEAQGLVVTLLGIDHE